MKTARHRSMLLIAALALATSLTACHNADSILLVEVAGDLNLMPVSFIVTVTPGQMPSKELRATPAGGGPVSLPASLSVELPASVTGPVTVKVDALNSYSYVIATGTATQQNLNVGGQTILVVTIVAPEGTITPDAGSPVDAGDAAVDAAAPADAGRDGGTRDAAVADGARRPDAAREAGGPRDGGGGS